VRVFFRTGLLSSGPQDAQETQNGKFKILILCKTTLSRQY